MSFDVKLDIAEVLESFEITGSGLLPVTNGTKSVELAQLSELLIDTDIAGDDEEFPEGKELTQLHKRKERNPKVVLEKKKRVLREKGKLECEVCKFDFVKKYGQLGYGFAECHHIVPVSKLTEGHKTKLSDLAIVCANCHRMLHKARPLISIDQLQTIIKENAAS